MDSLFNVNGLMFWTEAEVAQRNSIKNHVAYAVKTALLDMNPAWRFMEVESPILTPRALVNAQYTDEDVFFVGDLALRPETTPGTYQYIQHLLSHNKVRPPVCVWQVGKSFRREQDQPSKHVKLKEFYQQEFQCAFTDDSGCDYHDGLLRPVEKAIWGAVGLPTRLVDSDRLPHYSRKTVDVEVDNGDKWMEVASISLRTDFPDKYRTAKRNGEVVERNILVAEVAVGLDRLNYNYFIRLEGKK